MTTKQRFDVKNFWPKMFLGMMVVAMLIGLMTVDMRPVHAGEVVPTSGYKVLDPIRHGNLTVFPVVTGKSYATGDFLTLDEGLRSGEVVVTESGNLRGLIRGHARPALQHDGAQVNRLVLINNSSVLCCCWRAKLSRAENKTA